MHERPNVGNANNVNNVDVTSPPIITIATARSSRNLVRIVSRFLCAQTKTPPSGGGSIA
jgi:hypothetical protein